MWPHMFVQEVQGQAQEPQTQHYVSLADALQQSWGGLHATKTHKLLPVLLCEPLAWMVYKSFTGKKMPRAENGEALALAFTPFTSQR